MSLHAAKRIVAPLLCLIATCSSCGTCCSGVLCPSWPHIADALVAHEFTVSFRVVDGIVACCVYGSYDQSYNRKHPIPMLGGYPGALLLRTHPSTRCQHSFRSRYESTLLPYYIERNTHDFPSDDDYRSTAPINPSLTSNRTSISNRDDVGILTSDISGHEESNATGLPFCCDSLDTTH